MKRTEYWKKECFGLLVPVTTEKRSHPTAQRCRAATTLGSLAKKRRNPIGVAEDGSTRSQRSRRAATLGFGAQPLRGYLLLMLILFLSGFVSAQTNSSITGRVTDQHGASVAGAEILLRSRNGSQSVAATDDNGTFSFRNVASGEYVLEIRKSGFATFTSNELSVAHGQSLTNDFKLSVEAVSESVVVTAAGTAQRIDEVSKAVSVLDDQSIEARRELTLAESLRGTPGIRIQQQGSIGALTTVRLRGLRNFDTAILLDGLRVRASAGAKSFRRKARLEQLLRAGPAHARVETVERQDEDDDPQLPTRSFDIR